MHQHALIMGGTYGLGLELAKVASTLGIMPIICGRSVDVPERKDQFPSGVPTVRFDAEQPDGFVSHLPHFAVEADYVIYNSGVFLRQRLADSDPHIIRRLLTVNLTTAIEVTQAYHARRLELTRKPYHLILIASSSSFKVRSYEAAYCASKAGLAHFGRNLASELHEDLPGTKVLIVNPGGIRTELFDGTNQDTASFMDPRDAAIAIWSEARVQRTTPDELNILRGEKPNSYEISHGPKTPEVRAITIP